MSLVIIDPAAEAGSIVALWNSCAGVEFPLDERLLLQQLTLDTDPRRCFAFKDARGRLIAVLLAKRAARPGPSGTAPDVGMVSMLAVSEPERRQGLASAMLEAAISWLASLGAKNLRLGGDHYHLMPGRPIAQADGYRALEAFAKARGFQDRGAEYDLIADLRSIDAEEPEGMAFDAARYELRASKLSDRAAILGFMARSFPGRWTSEILEAMDAGMRDIDLVIAVDRADGSVVGFSRIYDDDSPVLGPGVYWRAAMGPRPGGLGPIGVDASRRGAGLGMGLLRYCVRELRSRGVETMVIDWTDLIDFYGKIGFTLWKRYELMGMPIQIPSA